MTAPKHRIGILATVLVAALTSGVTAWTLDLPDSVSVEVSTVRVSDLCRASVPAAAGKVVVAAGLRPGTVVTVSARSILRRLVVAGCADGVTLAGAAACRITVDGQRISKGELVDRIRAALQPHLPEAPAGAPPTWMELTVPALDAAMASSWSVGWPRPRPLEAGRNLVNVELRSDNNKHHLTVVATVHAFARTPRTASALGRGQSASPDALQWVWTDLATAGAGALTEPQHLDGMILTRNLDPGDPLTLADLAPRPAVTRGAAVDLVVRRGTIRAIVRAECRQDGRIGQVVSVLNPLTRRLVVAQVEAPGVVIMGR